MARKAADRLSIRERLDRRQAALDDRKSEQNASNAGGFESVRQAERVDVKAHANPGLVERADAAGMSIREFLALPEASVNEAPTRTAPDLHAVLALLGEVAAAKALSVNYRVLAFGASHVGACAPWGAARVTVDLGLASDICVDAIGFLETLKNLPKSPFSCAVEGTMLHWTCGTRKGYLAGLDATVAVPHNGGREQSLAPDFGKTLELGALACASTALTRSAGLEGVQLYNSNGRAYAAASDGMMVSSCCLGAALPLAKNAVATLKPEAAALLAEVIKREVRLKTEPAPHLSIDRASLYCLTSDVEVQLNQLAPLAHNLADKLAPFRTGTMAVPLQRQTIASFLKGAEALAEVRQQTMVDLAVKGGNVTLAFREETGAVQDFYLVEGGPKVDVPPIRIETRRLARALAHAEEMVFDYAAQHVLVLRGPDEFLLGVAGRDD